MISDQRIEESGDTKSQSVFPTVKCASSRLQFQLFLLYFTLLLGPKVKRDIYPCRGREEVHPPHRIHHHLFPQAVADGEGEIRQVLPPRQAMRGLGRLDREARALQGGIGSQRQALQFLLRVLQLPKTWLPYLSQSILGLPVQQDIYFGPSQAPHLPERDEPVRHLRYLYLGFERILLDSLSHRVPGGRYLCKILKQRLVLLSYLNGSLQQVKLVVIMLQLRHHEVSGRFIFRFRFASHVAGNVLLQPELTRKRDFLAEHELSPAHGRPIHCPRIGGHIGECHLEHRVGKRPSLGHLCVKRLVAQPGSLQVGIDP